MQSGLTSSCLQQREATGYPYMFHDPLHSLSSSYNSRAAACNPAVAHTQPTTHPSYASGSTPTSAVPVSTGTGKKKLHKTISNGSAFICVKCLQ